MWILSVFVILPKTLWTTTTTTTTPTPQPQLTPCKSATKFKAKFLRRHALAAAATAAAAAVAKLNRKYLLLTIQVGHTIQSNSRSRKSGVAACAAAVAFRSKQYFNRQLRDVECVARSERNSYNSAAPTVLTPLLLVSLIALVLIFISIIINIIIVTNIVIVNTVNVQPYFRRCLHNAVISTGLAFLMNDIRQQTTCKPIIVATTTATTIVKTVIEKLIEFTVTKASLFKAIRTVFESNRNNSNRNKNSVNNNNKQPKTLSSSAQTTTNNNKKNNTNTNTSEAANNTPTNPLYRQVDGVRRFATASSTSLQPTSGSSLSLSSSLSHCNNNNITVAALVILRFLFNNNSFTSNNHRTYNNSSKSNKVFLHYTPRDPRLRRTRNDSKINYYNKSKQEIHINKHHFDSVSELKITEDLCAYGELIGGSFYNTTATNTTTTTTRKLIIIIIKVMNFQAAQKHIETSQEGQESREAAKQFLSRVKNSAPFLPTFLCYVAPSPDPSDAVEVFSATASGGSYIEFFQSWSVIIHSCPSKRNRGLFIRRAMSSSKAL
ncbi:integrator complex subunit 5-like protein [Ceratitis capitata]|uniref:integrator complex subunit 5-like protein n=1 Tax=Ceratitis capitata TaxID=7213 RepID=UPI000A0F793A|nr:integrator complex subunit 5-like protein [Ceratitis capitata]